MCLGKLGQDIWCRKWSSRSTVKTLTSVLQWINEPLEVWKALRSHMHLQLLSLISPETKSVSVPHAWGRHAYMYFSLVWSARITFWLFHKAFALSTLSSRNIDVSGNNKQTSPIVIVDESDENSAVIKLSVYMSYVVSLELIGTEFFK